MEDKQERDEQVVATKALRRDLDAVLQEVRKLNPSREVSLSITNIQQGIMWLGMNLKGLNEPTPYPSSYDPSSTTVEPTADNLNL